MNAIDWAQAGRVSVIVIVCIGVYGLLAVWIARKLADMRTDYEDAEEQRVLEDARRKRRLATLLAIAEEFEASPEHEQQQMQRRAEMLGFMDQNDRMVS
ncbi:MAG: hypothetical protein M3P26_15775 [Gemmatimonadota bacterium]|nr:hypothetical protein [Gemmatimonadota bacterium]